MEVTEEIENQIVETLHKIRVFDESINSLIMHHTFFALTNDDSQAGK